MTIHLDLLDVILLLNTTATGTLGRLFLFKSQPFSVLAISRSAVVGLFEHRIGLNGLKLGLEAGETASTKGAAVGTATGVGKVVTVVLCFDAGFTPTG